MITKRIIAPLIIMIVLSGIGGIVAAKKRIEAQLIEARSASEVR